MGGGFGVVRGKLSVGVGWGVLDKKLGLFLSYPISDQTIYTITPHIRALGNS